MATSSQSNSSEINSEYSSDPIAFSTNRIFIGNLASELEEFTIYKYCSAYGEISKCQIMKEPKTDRSRGFGFITYAHSSSAEAILNARPHYIGHHKINVKPANPIGETMVHSNTTELSSTLPKTKRLFIAYNKNEASRNGLVEPAIFGYLSTFGVVKEIVQQFSTSMTKQNHINDYWIVEFFDDSSVNYCMSKGSIQYCSGVRLNLKRVITEQDILRRKRKAQEEDITSTNAIMAQGTTTTSLLTQSPLYVPVPPPPPMQTASAKPYTHGNQMIQSVNNAEDMLRGYGYQHDSNNLAPSQKLYKR